MRHFTRFILVSCLLILSSQFSWAEFRNFSILVDNSENSLLTAAEKATQWTQYEFGVAVADDGTVTRVEKDADLIEDTTDMITLLSQQINAESDHVDEDLLVQIKDLQETVSPLFLWLMITINQLVRTSYTFTQKQYAKNA